MEGFNNFWYVFIHQSLILSTLLNICMRLFKNHVCLGFCIYECQLTAHILTVGQTAWFFVFVLFCTSKADLFAKKCWKYLWIQTSPWTPPGDFYPTNHIMKIGAFTHIMSSQFKIMGKKKDSHYPSVMMAETLI